MGSRQNNGADTALKVLIRLVMWTWIIAVGWVLYSLVYPLRVLDVYGTLWTSKSEYMQGEPFVFWMESRKYVAEPCEITIRWMDSLTYVGVTFVTDRDVGWKAGWISPGLVPEGLPPGQYYVQVKFSYPINAIRGDMVISANTTGFRVLPKGG